MHNNSTVPRDIIIDVLLKLPAKSLIRFKVVCKSWRSQIEDAQFINLHHNRCKSDINRHKFLVSCNKKDDHHYYYYYYSIDAPLQHDSVVSLVDVIPGVNYDQLSRVCINSCNGILVLVFPYDEVIFWNPTIRESRKIPSPILKRRDRKRFPAVYGFGYVSSVDDYKIVRIGQKHCSRNYDVEIFWTKKSKSWELIGNVSGINYPSGGPNIVVVDGIVYIMEISERSSDDDFTITRFGLEKGQYETILFPDRIKLGENPQLYALDEILCLTRLRKESELYFEVWYMKKNASWSRIMIELIHYNSYYARKCWIPVTFTKNGDLLLLRYGTEFVVYNSINHKFEQLKVTGLEPSLTINWIVPYVDTLFSPH